MTLREMRSRMGADEYHEWLEFYNVRPFGFDRREQMHGDLMSSIWALHGSKECSAKLRSDRHWMYEAQSEEISPENEAEMMLARRRG